MIWRGCLINIANSNRDENVLYGRRLPLVLICFWSNALWIRSVGWLARTQTLPIRTNWPSMYSRITYASVPCISVYWHCVCAHNSREVRRVFVLARAHTFLVNDIRHVGNVKKKALQQNRWPLPWFTLYVFQFGDVAFNIEAGKIWLLRTVIIHAFMYIASVDF